MDLRIVGMGQRVRLRIPNPTDRDVIFNELPVLGVPPVAVNPTCILGSITPQGPLPVRSRSARQFHGRAGGAVDGAGAAGAAGAGPAGAVAGASGAGARPGADRSA